MFLNKVDKRKIALFQLLENAPMLTESKKNHPEVPGLF